MKTIFATLILCTHLFSEITPQQYLELSKTSTNILASYNNFKEDLEYRKPKIFDTANNRVEIEKNELYLNYTFNSYFPFDNAVVVPTPLGNFNGNIQKILMGINISWAFKTFELGVRAYFDDLSIFAWEEDNPNMKKFFKNVDQEAGINWQSGYDLAAFNYNEFGKYDITVGVLDKKYPMLNKDGSAFQIDTLNPGSPYTSKSKPFFDIDYYGYRLYSLSEFGNVFDIFSFEKEIQRTSFLFTPTFNFFSYRNRSQAGVHIANHLENFPLQVDYEGMMDVHEKNGGEMGLYSHLYVDFMFSLFKNPEIRIPNQDFHILVNPRFSYSSDVLDKSILGASLTLCLQNMFHLSMFEIGAAYQDYKYTLQSPYQDKFIAHFQYQIGF